MDKGLLSNYSSETDSMCKHWPVAEFSLPACQNIYGKQDDIRFNHSNCHFEMPRWKVLQENEALLLLLLLFLTNV